MDFGSLTRRELQSLCKLNKIPANITNVAMANALKSLEIVEGIEEFLNASKSETADSIESKENVEIASPKVPQTICKTTTRQKVEILPPTATRTTRRETRQMAGNADESKKYVLKTPVVSSSQRKAPATSSCRNASNQLKECEEEVTQSRRKGATVKKEESTVQKAYSTRRSTRLIEKKSAEPSVRKESPKAVKIDSFLDEVNVASKEESDNPSAEVEEICNAFEKLDVLRPESDEISNPSEDEVVEVKLNVEEATVRGEEGKENCIEIENLKTESDEISNPCEDGDAEEKLNVEEATLEGEEGKEDCVEIENQKTESDEISNACEDRDVEAKPNVEEVMFESGDENEDCDEIENLKVESDVILNPCEDGEDDENVSEEVESKAISEKFSAVKEDNLVMVPEEHSDSLLNKARLESRTDDDIEIDAIPFNTQTFCDPSNLVHEETKNQIPDSNGSTTMACDVIPSSTENSNNFNLVEEIPTNGTKEGVSLNIVDETVDLIDNLSTMIKEVEDHRPECNVNVSFSIEEKTQNASVKKMMIVSDDKENMEIVMKMDEEEKKKKEKEGIENMSMRQLRKQLKALSLKKINQDDANAANNNNKEATKTRKPLQALCDNQFV